MSNKIAKKKIQQLVFLHAMHCHKTYKIPVNQKAERDRIYADFQADLITLDDIDTDITEYLKMRGDV